MKVLMFGWEFPPYISGGLGTACFGLTRQMSAQGMDITFVVPKLKGQMPHKFVNFVDGQEWSVPDKMGGGDKILEKHLSKYLKVNSVLSPYLNNKTYDELKSEVEVQRSLQAQGGETNFQKIFFSGDYGNNLLEEVKRYSLVGYSLGAQEDFQVIHAHDWLTYLAGIEAKKVSGKPLVVHIHATEFDRSGEHINQDIYEIERYGFHMSDKVIAVSHRTRDMVIQRYGVAPEKVKVVHNAVEKTEAFSLEDTVRSFGDDKIVTFLGRLTMQKGPEYFVDAARLVIDHVKNVRFVMAGSGDMTKGLVNRMASYGIADRFHFTGFLNEAEREKLFAMSDLYIMPSVSEPFGITPLEVMKYNIPIIISKQSGVAEILKSAIKVDFWDVDRIASSIINILENPPLRDGLVSQYESALEKIDWGIAAEQVIHVYRDVLSVGH